MKILSIKPGHDGAVSYIEDAELVFSFEPEKDSLPRYSPISTAAIVSALELLDSPPDVLAIGGWHRPHPLGAPPRGLGYLGLDTPIVRETKVFGRPTLIFTSTHERSHIYMAVGMASPEPIEECAVLVWEGAIGAIYHWKDFGRSLRKFGVLSHPGTRYAALFDLADPSAPAATSAVRAESAGKLMALAAYGSAGAAAKEDIALLEDLLTASDGISPFDKARFVGSGLFDAGVTSDRVAHAARYLTERIFVIFEKAFVDAGLRGLPLVISGGCGLNCEWNEAWRKSGIASSVFVPPCANDSGSSIGTAIDALHTIADWRGGIRWTVYSGAHWVDDGGVDPPRLGWATRPFDLVEIADELARDEVFVWVQGHAEIGPRALGHRSILASPLVGTTRDRLNRIKQREGYRPIAPAVLASHAHRWMEVGAGNPYMLYFTTVKSDEIPAVTHIDSTARPQFVQPDDGSSLSDLLVAFERRTGVGVLCNTSLNYPGLGFMNRSSEILQYCEVQGISNACFDNRWLQLSDAAS
jgi:hydroxymethyl cephem carbamoyltransferase